MNTLNRFACPECGAQPGKPCEINADGSHKIHAARLRIKPIAPPLVWTTARPTVSGWYWVKSGGPDVKPEIVRVRGGGLVNQLWFMFLDRGITEDVSKFGPCLWAGPIPEPEEER